MASITVDIREAFVAAIAMDQKCIRDEMRQMVANRARMEALAEAHGLSGKVLHIRTPEFEARARRN
ncbi:MAG TPA: hypothetical protein VMZ92_21755 [Planctomycetota bacterium]|nr:hypothetical protein [Planctomycetota bacterium]